MEKKTKRNGEEEEERKPPGLVTGGRCALFMHEAMLLSVLRSECRLARSCFRPKQPAAARSPDCVDELVAVRRRDVIFKNKRYPPHHRSKRSVEIAPSLTTRYTGALSLSGRTPSGQ